MLYSYDLTVMCDVTITCSQGDLSVFVQLSKSGQILD